MKLFDELRRLVEGGQMLPPEQEEDTKPMIVEGDYTTLADAPTKDLTNLTEAAAKFLRRATPPDPESYRFGGTLKSPVFHQDGTPADMMPTGVLLLPANVDTDTPKKVERNFTMQAYAGFTGDAAVIEEIFGYWIDLFEITPEEQSVIDDGLYTSFKTNALPMSADMPLTWRLILMRDVVYLTHEVVEIRQYKDLRILGAFTEAIFLALFLCVRYTQTLGLGPDQLDIRDDGYVTLLREQLDVYGGE